jgi:hypothetical protein
MHMSVRFFVLLAGTSAMLGGTASAADVGSTTPAAKPEKQVCRRVSHVGSRLGELTCLTKSQWAALEKENNVRARKTARDTEDRNSGYLNPERESSRDPMGPN